MNLKIPLFSLFLGCSCVAAERNSPLTILFSGSANGILNSCHCPSNPWGGLAKRAWLIKALRTTAGADRVVTIDSGDLFPVEANPERAALLLTLFSQMDYQAVALGDQELAGGLDPWGKINQAAGMWNTATGCSTFPWLSGGYQVESGTRQNKALPPAWTVIKRCGLRIGIVSVSHADIWRLSKSIPEGIRLTSSSDTIKAFLKATAGQLDLAIVLSHQGAAADRLLAAQVKGIDLIIGGHSQSLISPPEVINGVAICQAGKNGENLGVLLLRPQPSSDFPAPRSAFESQDPFSPTVADTRRWRFAQQIIPLNTAVDDAKPAAALISAYNNEPDAQNAKRLSAPDPQAKTNTPILVLSLPSQPVAATFGERKNVSVVIGNRGNVPLTIEKVRSKSPWMQVTGAPSLIAPFSEAEIHFELATEILDRFFRCDFSVVANDPLRPVVQGSFTGYAVGTRHGLLDTPAVWSNLVDRLNEATPRLRPEREPLLSGLLPVTPAADSERRIRVEYFYAPGCSDCQVIERDILPDLVMRFEGLMDLRKIDVTVTSNYLHFTRLSERQRIRPDNTVSVFVDEAIPLLGLEAIRENLARTIEERIGRRQP